MWDRFLPVSVSSNHVERKEQGDLLTNPSKNPKPNKNEDHDLERGPVEFRYTEWLQEFSENLVDDSFSHEPSLEPSSARSEDLGKHSVFSHFPKDRNCEICQRTKSTRSPCRRRIGGAVLHAEN